MSELSEYYPSKLREFSKNHDVSSFYLKFTGVFKGCDLVSSRVYVTTKEDYHPILRMDFPISLLDELGLGLTDYCKRLARKWGLHYGGPTVSYLRNIQKVPYFQQTTYTRDLAFLLESLKVCENKGQSAAIYEFSEGKKSLYCLWRYGEPEKTYSHTTQLPPALKGTLYKEVHGFLQKKTEFEKSRIGLCW